MLQVTGNRYTHLKLVPAESSVVSIDGRGVVCGCIDTASLLSVVGLDDREDSSVVYMYLIKVGCPKDMKI